MIRLSTSELRKDTADALNRVVYRGDRIALQRRGKDVVYADEQPVREMADILSEGRAIGALGTGITGGTGMGLTISKSIVSLHGGTITASNRPAGSGACFDLFIPF